MPQIPLPMETAFARHASKTEGERIALGWAAELRWFVWTPLIGTLVTVLIALVPMIDAVEQGHRAQTLALRVPSGVSTLPTYELLEDDSLNVSFVTWTFPSPYQVTKAWVQLVCESKSVGPTSLTLPSQWSEVTLWNLPASILGTGKHDIYFTYEVSDGDKTRLVRISMVKSWMRDS